MNIHHRRVEAEANHRNHEFGLQAAGEARTVFRFEQIGVEVHRVYVDAYARTDRKLGGGRNRHCDYSHSREKETAEIFHRFLINYVNGAKLTLLCGCSKLCVRFSRQKQRAH